MIRPVIALLALICSPSLTVEAVDVPGRGVIDLETFACTDTPRSTLVQRVCYDEREHRLLVQAGGTYAEYCELPAATFQSFIVAPSMGRFYRQRVATGEFPCRGAAGK